MSHARLGPSNHRWPNCPGSVREEAGYPDVAGAAAIDGTGSHLLLEMCLENNVPAIQYDRQVIGANHPDSPNGWLVDIARCERVQMCLDYVTRRVKELKRDNQGCTVTVHAEMKSDPGGLFGRDDWWGTCDITLICRHDHTGDVMFLEVIDYKDGRGYVKAKDNTQLISYLAGQMRPFIGSGPDLVRPFRTEKVKDCRMTIVQPKTNPKVRYVCSTSEYDSLSVLSVIEEASRMNKAAYETDDPNAPVRPGKWCQWCKANPKRGGHCSAATDKSLQVVKLMSNTNEINENLPIFEQVSKAVSNPQDLTNEELSQLASAEPGLMAAFDACKKEIQRRVEDGQNVPGWAMRPGRASRKWNESEDSIVKKLKGKRLKLDEIYPKKLVSPAALLKSSNLSEVQKKKIEEELVSYVEGKLTLQKVSHDVVQSSTNALQSAEEMFGDVSFLDNKPSEEISFL